MALLEADLEHSYYWTDDWDPVFYVALARAGFISTAIEHPEVGSVLIPELQQAYAVLDEGDLHVSKNVAKLIASGRIEEDQIELEVSDECDRVLAKLLAYHSDSTWLSPAYCDLVRRISGSASKRVAEAGQGDSAPEPRPEFRFRAIELWSRRENRLIAGELGYSIGRTYTSLSGFCEPTEKRWRNFGTLQLVLLAKRLAACGYAFWNLGHPHLSYKGELGAKVTPRGEFLTRWRTAIEERPPQAI